ARQEGPPRRGGVPQRQGYTGTIAREGQFVPVDVDGSAEEGTPYIPAHGMRREVFVPRPSGLRFYHTHTMAGADLNAGQYSGQVGPVYIESATKRDGFDREEFL